MGTRTSTTRHGVANHYPYFRSQPPVAELMVAQLIDEATESVDKGGVLLLVVNAETGLDPDLAGSRGITGAKTIIPWDPLREVFIGVQK